MDMEPALNPNDELPYLITVLGKVVSDVRRLASG
jgi:hypothetical protein